MPQANWSRMKSLFREAIELPQSQREQFVNTRCDDDTERAELRRLLASHSDESDFLQSPLAARVRPDETALVGQRIDDFKLVKRIGVGGMGVVFEAEQSNPKRRVALKLLHPGRITRKTLWRFRHESEILARLQHPGIAQVHSSGVCDLGHGQQPWFAMELIDGEPLHHFAEESTLLVRERLQLLLGIADAVQHAHERGVTHRDLKPANIVVQPGTGSDGVPQPKILDFGIAQADRSDDETATFQTETGEILGTINYMSPERFKGRADTVDHRCDVYALGVIGYELLSAQLPIDASAGNIAEGIRRIEQDEPTTLGNLNPAFRGDIEVIIARSLEKEPARRYQSAREFADDIRRHLANEPISARAPSVAYRASRFVRRNAVLVAGVTSTIIALAIGMSLYAVEAANAREQARLASEQAEVARDEAAKATYEAEKAQAVNNFMANDFMMKVLAAGPQPEGQPLPVSDLVAKAASHVSEMYEGKPTIEAAVRNEIATVYYNVHNWDAAASEFRTALQLWETELGPDHPDTLKAVNNLAMTLRNQGLADQALPLYRRALETRVRVLGESAAETRSTMNNLGQYLSTRKDPAQQAEGEQMLARALQLSPPADEKLKLTILANLGSVHARRRDFAKAAEFHRQAYEGLNRTLGQDHVHALHGGSRYAQTLQRLGEAAEAKQILEPVLAAYEQLHGPAHPDCFSARRLISRIERDLGNVDAASKHLRQALDAAKSEPEKFAAAIAKIESELGRLER